MTDGSSAARQISGGNDRERVVQAGRNHDPAAVRVAIGTSAESASSFVLSAVTMVGPCAGADTPPITPIGAGYEMLTHPGGRFRTTCNIFRPRHGMPEHPPQARDSWSSRVRPHQTHLHHAPPPPDAATSPDRLDIRRPRRRPDDDHAFCPVLELAAQRYQRAPPIGRHHRNAPMHRLPDLA
jgi:hypothetical protein